MHTYNNISRRLFLKRSALALPLIAGLPSFIQACSPPQQIPGVMVNDNSKAGHLLRDKTFKLKPTRTVTTKTLIVGAGISGLSTAYHLKKNNHNDFIVLDLAPQHGGNAVSGSNALSAYPWAAHYLPIVNNTNSALIGFLKDHDVITGFNNEGLPVYNEYYLCFDPEERLFINGHWQDGLIPSFGLDAGEKKEIARFFDMVHDYKNKTGSDGQPAFEIPISRSSSDKEFRDLDLISFSDFLSNHKFSSAHLLWYLNYCCKDDYGSTLSDTSAYAGLHYFCARRAKAANAEASAVLTWPQGNSFLADLLIAPCRKHVLTNHLVTSVTRVNGKIQVISFNTLTEECVEYISDEAVLCCPQYINARILSPELQAQRPPAQLFEYTPWVVANISVTELPEYSGEPLSWDNVLYGSKSLGYVNACHQHLNSKTNGLVLTYYLPLAEVDVKQARQQLRERSHAELAKDIVNDLKSAHKDIEKYITSIDIKIWGHGMIKPKPGFMFNPELQKQVSNSDQLFFAHTDLAGISIFEEGFEQGINIANQLIKRYDTVSKA